jgi:serine phosphatase RsbU (regulator of sigma subunit)
VSPEPGAPASPGPTGGDDGDDGDEEEVRVNVLLVDDHEENLTALSAVLAPLGENLVLARSGAEALHHLLDADFALILLDVHMPDLGGFETARYITARERTRHIPIIFLTAFAADVEEVFRGYEAGAVDYVTKPFEPEVLRSKVAVFVSLHREREQRMSALAAAAKAEAAYEQEHRLVELLQRSLLPQELPEIPGLELAARYLPSVEATAVGGDWYDVLQLPGGDVCMVIGDVVGKGMQAATVMGELRNGLRAYVLEGHGPAAALTRLNALVEQTHGARMIGTLLVLRVEPRRGVVRFASAGHLPPLRVGPGAEAAFVTGGLVPPLGMIADDPVEEAVLTVATGTSILLFTDGLVERRDESLDVGLARLRASAEGIAAVPLESFCDQILEAVEIDGTEHRDDVAMIALRLLADEDVY